MKILVAVATGHGATREIAESADLVHSVWRLDARGALAGEVAAGDDRPALGWIALALLVSGAVALAGRPRTIHCGQLRGTTMHAQPGDWLVVKEAVVLTADEEQAAEDRARTRLDRVRRYIHEEDGHVRVR